MTSRSGGDQGKGQKRPLPESATLHRFFKRLSGDGNGGGGVEEVTTFVDAGNCPVLPCKSTGTGTATALPTLTASALEPENVQTNAATDELRSNPDGLVGLEVGTSSSAVLGTGTGHLPFPPSPSKRSDDIGDYAHAGASRPDDYTIHSVLTKKPFQLDPVNLPFSVHVKQGKEERRYLKQTNLLDPRYSSWLVYSPQKKGLFCKYCPFFVPGNKRGGVALQKLVTEPVNTYAKLLGADGFLEKHSKNKYHIEAVLAGQDFLRTYTDPKGAICNLLESHRLGQLESRRLALIPVVKSIILCGRQCLPLRGHRDSGRLTMEAPDHNDGNLRALLRFRADAGDTILREKLSGENDKMRYISPQHQNELIHICGEEIRDQLKTQIQEAKYFSIIFDETSDRGHVSQLSLVIRYMHDKVLREDFMQFLDAREAALGIAMQKIQKDDTVDEAEDLVLEELNETEEENRITLPEPVLTGEVTGKIALDAAAALGLNIDHCVGVGTDSCSTMMSEAKGAVTEILKKAKHAVRCPCGSHSLNNSLSKSSKVQHVKTTSATIQQTSTFLNSSSKRNIVVRKIMGKGGLMKLCETRFVERHDAFLEFRDLLPLIVEVLQNIMTWTDAKAAADAQSLLLSITNSAFIVTLTCMCDLFALTMPLARLLQKPTLDVQTASEHLNDVLNALEEKRLQADNLFTVLFCEAEEIAQKIGCNIAVPARFFRRSRAGHPVDEDPEIYYRQAIYIPILDTVLQDMHERFPRETLEIYGLTCLLPSYLISSEFSEDMLKKQTAAITAKYSTLFSTSSRSFEQLLQGQLQLWRSKWERTEKSTIPKDVTETLAACDSEVFPYVCGLLQVLASLPVTTCSAERSFSTLTRLKSYLRSTMNEDRLTGLALLNVHRNIGVSADRVVERFLKSHRRPL